MSIKIHLHPDMYYLADNNEFFETSGNTVGDCIDRLIQSYPGLHDLVFYKDGQLQTFIEIYVNRKAACPNELTWEVRDGDEIHLIMTIAGG